MLMNLMLQSFIVSFDIFLAGPLASFMLKIFGARRGICISTAITVIGFIASAFVTSFVWLCICFGVLCGNILDSV